MMTARSNAGTGSGLQVGSFFYLLILMKIVVAQPATDFHEPGEAEMNDEAAYDGSGIGGEHAKDKTAEKRRDAFAQGFSKVDDTVEGGHWKDRILSDEAEEADDEQAAEEELDAEKVEAI